MKEKTNRREEKSCRKVLTRNNKCGKIEARHNESRMREREREPTDRSKRGGGQGVTRETEQTVAENEHLFVYW